MPNPFDDIPANSGPGLLSGLRPASTRSLPSMRKAVAEMASHYASESGPISIKVCTNCFSIASGVEPTRERFALLGPIIELMDARRAYKARTDVTFVTFSECRAAEIMHRIPELMLDEEIFRFGNVSGEELHDRVHLVAHTWAMSNQILRGLVDESSDNPELGTVRHMIYDGTMMGMYAQIENEAHFTPFIPGVADYDCPCVYLYRRDPLFERLSFGFDKMLMPPMAPDYDTLCDAVKLERLLLEHEPQKSTDPD